MRLPIFLLLFTIILSSCNNKSGNKNKADEGLIIYDVSYYASEKENPIVALLPNKVELRFKENNISLTSEGYLGFFSTKFISNFECDKSHILLKVLNNKFNYEFPKEEVAFIYNQLSPTKIKYLDESKIVAGYKCKVAKLFFEDKTINPIKVAYTEEIGLANPNRNTPLNEIEGVLMEFETTMNKIRTKFTAESVSLEEICQDEFTVPEGYVLSDKATLKKYILGFN
ncbi:hypothetical protein DF185_10245 [Marinifilum breve]|uniref:DUF4412 domain-containing protein n=1 Tax=Marinifilum breve TaxID=2184082 RepID=A0A2V3ZXI8_9BACT|nr:hypothetical protein [Marinifilum breve]PXY01026.1 hypothetical protein DF185_10245 [Marinifilum breve]